MLDPGSSLLDAAPSGSPLIERNVCQSFVVAASRSDQIAVADFVFVFSFRAATRYCGATRLGIRRAV
jgi:hypothetical protein